MNANWETRWKDYYELLQVHPIAEPEVVKAAYDRLARKYHPDVNSDQSAADRMANINEAYDILKDPAIRAQYDVAWRQHQGLATQPPKPMAIPQQITFADVEAHQVVKSRFIVRNTGGRYTKPVIDDPDSWLKVIGATPATTDQTDLLPAIVEIEAEAPDWGQTLAANIKIRLINEDIGASGETHVKVDLNTKAAPAGTPLSAGSPYRKAPSPGSSLVVEGWAYLLVDCSASMSGFKFDQAKQGAAGFARDAIAKGYATGLIEFYWSATHLSQPTREMSTLERNIRLLKIRKVGLLGLLGSLFRRWNGGTNMAEGIRLAHMRLQPRTGDKAIIVITDGQPNAPGDPLATLNAGDAAKKDGIDIITIGTDQADQWFLKKLASRADLGMKVSTEDLQETIIHSTQLLSSGK